MLTDTKTNNLRIVLHQIYVSLYVEYGMFRDRCIFHSECGMWRESRDVGPCCEPKQSVADALLVIIVVKNPLSPVEHPGGLGVNCEMFELGLEQFIVSLAIVAAYCVGTNLESLV